MSGAFTVADLRLVEVRAVELGQAQDHHVHDRLQRKLPIRSWERATLCPRFEPN